MCAGRRTSGEVLPAETRQQLTVIGNAMERLSWRVCCNLQRYGKANLDSLINPNTLEESHALQENELRHMTELE